MGRVATGRNSTISSDSHLEIDHPWSDKLPDQGLNPQPLQWKNEVLITGLSGRSHQLILLKIISNTTVISIEKPRDWDQHRDHTFYSGISHLFM